MHIRAQQFLHSFDYAVSIFRECNYVRKSKEDYALFGSERHSFRKPCHRRRHYQGHLSPQCTTSVSVCAYGYPIRGPSTQKQTQLLSASVNPRVESCTHVTHEMHILSDMAFIWFLFYYSQGNILLFEITVIGESYYLEFNFRLVKGLWVQRDGKRMPR